MSFLFFSIRLGNRVMPTNELYSALYLHTDQMYTNPRPTSQILPGRI